MSAITCATYSSGTFTQSYECSGGSVCAINTQVGLWGCAASAYISTQPGSNIVGSLSFALGCVGYTDISNCGPACQAFTSRTTCSNVNFPYCVTLLLEYSGPLAAYYCDSGQDLAYNGLLHDGAIEVTVTRENVTPYFFYVDGATSVPSSALPGVPVGLPFASSTSTITLVSSSSSSYSATPSAAPSSTISSTLVQSTTSQSPISSSVSSSAAITSSSSQIPTSLTSTTSSIQSSTLSSTNPPSSSATSTPVVQSTSNGLTAGASAGIGVGVAVGALALVSLIAFLIYRRRKKSKQAREGDTRYSLASNGNDDDNKSPRVMSSTTPYLDHPYTPRMHMQEMGSNSRREKLEVKPMSPNNEIREKTYFLQPNGQPNESATNEVSEAPCGNNVSELPDQTGMRRPGLGVAELDGAGRR